MYMKGYCNNLRELSKDEVIKIAPSVLTTEGSENLSNRYSSINTLDIMEVLALDGWFPVKTQEVCCRKDNKKGYQKHMITFQNKDYMFEERCLQANITNSHDGLSAYQFFLGMLEKVCSNGLMVGNSFDSIHLKHIGLEQSQVEQASQKMLNYVPTLNNSINSMKRIKLSLKETEIFAESAKMILYPKIENKSDIPLENSELLRPRQWGAQNNNDLWSIFNRVQENSIKGRLRFYSRNAETGRLQRKSTRAIKSIDRNISVNRALWNLAEEMKKIKTITN